MQVATRSRAARSVARKTPRVVIVTRQTEFEQLLARHCTREQARFFLETRGQSIDAPEESDRRFREALKNVLHSIPLDWRRTRVDRGDLDRFLFASDDLIVALGQDGLVANTAKYLDGQPVIGLNPEPDRYEGILVPHPVAAAPDLLSTVAKGKQAVEQRSMVEVALDDGQTLLALNEVFLGHKTHQSARYSIAWGEREERHSSSGVIVSSGTGATGWARSVHRNRRCELKLPAPADKRLVFFVREAWPSVFTGTDISEGELGEHDELELTSQMNDGGVIFGDGIESDRIEFSWGCRVRVRLAKTRLHLVR